MCQKPMNSSKYGLFVRKMQEAAIRQNLPYCRFAFPIPSSNFVASPGSALDWRALRLSWDLEVHEASFQEVSEWALAARGCSCGACCHVLLEPLQTDWSHSFHLVSCQSDCVHEELRGPNWAGGPTAWRDTSGLYKCLYNVGGTPARACVRSVVPQVPASGMFLPLHRNTTAWFIWHSTDRVPAYLRPSPIW